MKGIVTPLAVMSAVMGVALPAASAAPASARPAKVQTDGFGNWSGTWRIRPVQIGFGTNYLIRKLHYSDYNKASAFAHGRLLIDTCQPTCAKGGHYVDATAYFYHAASHAGPGRYFKDLRLRWHDHSRLLWINSRGQWWWRGA